MSITTGPVSAALDVPSLAEKVRAFVATARDVSADGLTLTEFGQLLVALLRIAVTAADSIPVDGSERKTYVLNAVGCLFDSVADRLVPTLAWPLWIVFRPSVRAALLLVVSGAIEQLLPLVRIAS